VQARLADPANAPIANSLKEIGINSAVELFATYAGQRGDMVGWLKDAIINTDRNLKLQYLAGQGLNYYRSDPIYKAMIRESKYPEGLFVGSQATLDDLRARVSTTRSSPAESRPPWAPR
jgi:spermidine synthase